MEKYLWGTEIINTGKLQKPPNSENSTKLYLLSA